MNNIKIMIVLIVIYFLYYDKLGICGDKLGICGDNKTESMNARPSEIVRNSYINQILNNTHLFKNYGHAFNKFKWMDAILYEDIRKLILQNKLSKEELKKLML